jgi:glyoxylate/hydroxypyruvate reductase A
VPPHPALIFISEYSDTRGWQRELTRLLPEVEFRVWPEIGRAEDIRAALVWKHPHDALPRFPNLQLVVSLGAGVDFIFQDPNLPDSVPVVRVVDAGLTRRIVEYVVLHVLALHRRLPELNAAQRAGQWRFIRPVDPAAACVGIMGIGNLGSHALAALGQFGFRLAGWSRTAKSLPGVQCFHGAAGLPEFLRGCDILVCLLPSTPATDDLIDATLFDQLPEGAAFISLGRGSTVVDEDLIAALDRGRLRDAVLDVFRTEPLPAGHPFWSHPKITITPHNSSATDPVSAAPQVADNIRRALAGQPVLNRVDRATGY